MARRIITYIATSADGYIARPDGNVDWLERPRVKGNYGVAAFFNSIDTILWGRRTFDEAEGRGGVRMFGPALKHFVFSTKRTEPVEGIEFVNQPIETFARRLRRQKGKDVMMMGGAGIIASFLDAGQIDEFIIHVVPIFIGEGIPLVAPRHRNVALRLKAVKRFPDGVVRHHYQVKV
jgi:dihydrofolate reductase